jgi:hypothetical protein
MWKAILFVLAVLALVGCSKRTSDAGKLIEATDPYSDCATVDERCNVQIGLDGRELKITLPDGSHLSIFAGLQNAAGNFVDGCIDDAAISDNPWISGGKRGNVALWVPLRSCNP